MLAPLQIGTNEFITYFLNKYLDECNEGIRLRQITKKHIVRQNAINNEDPFISVFQQAFANFYKIQSFQSDIWLNQSQTKKLINEMIRDKLIRFADKNNIYCSPSHVSPAPEHNKVDDSQEKGAEKAGTDQRPDEDRQLDMESEVER